MTANCQICGAKYKFCPECNRIDAYKKVVDAPDCYKVYLIIYEYRTHVIDKDKAKAEFTSVGITNNTLHKFNFLDSIRNYIADIIKEDVEIDNVALDDIEVEEEENKAYRKSKKNK